MTSLTRVVPMMLVATLAAGCTKVDTPAAGTTGSEAAAGSAAGAPNAAGSPGAPGASQPAGGTAAAAATAPAPPKLREITIPEGTSISLTLVKGAASDTSQIEDAVTATVAKPVMVADATAIPEGAEVSGSVVDAKGSGKVKGRGVVSIKFDRLLVRGEALTIQTNRLTRQAASDKKDDATKIGIGAGAGAVIGAIAGGGKGAAIGAAVGGGAGTGVAMATKGDEAHFPAGSTVTIKLQEPLKVLVPE